MKDRIELYDNAQEMLVCELDKIVKKQELSPTVLSYLDTIIDIIKDLDEIAMNEEERMYSDEKYSSRSGRMYNQDNSYRNNGNYNYDSSYRRGTSYRNGYRMSNDGYSRRGSSKGEMIEHLYMALDTASTDDERKRVQHMIDEIEKN